ncbi:zinc finger CCCH domain-containing protein 62 [Canna indica]|uniref:Zinc finger CCCH domain-containing protein 62 n=1 Tax=Canna indica TaxID=4628 RepID=A0AAQ3Q887_9LILI|nr:zinc finger CCCH domain-containing protein 62 [Canna indica]
MPRPAASDKRKAAVVTISSSSSDREAPETDSDDEEEVEDDEEEEEEDDEDEEEEDDDSDDEDYVCEEYEDGEQEGGQSEVAEEVSSSNEDDDEEEDAVGGKPTNEERYKKVINLLEKKRSLDALKLEECKSYLRKHGLLVSGTKATCIKRILDHCRLKDGNGEKLYPQSSFVIDCTGDVCKGDVVLFRQRIYNKFDKVTRRADIIGKRTVAGRVVKESYGAAKQQHTFTVEVLWSRGTNPLPLLFPLLVKGRNLYRLKTSRQRWSNELERSKVLAEKHQRGAAARHVRKISKEMTGKGPRCPKRSDDRLHFTKRRIEEPNHQTRRKKQKSACSPAAFHAHENIQAAVTRKAISERVPSANAPFNAHANMQTTRARNVNPSYASSRQAIYHEARVNPQCPLPWRSPFYNHHSTMELQPAMVPAQTRSTNILAPRYNAGYSFGMTGVPHHQLNMGNPYPNRYASAGTHVDPPTANQFWHQPDYGHGRGPALPPSTQFNRFWRS